MAEEYTTTLKWHGSKEIGQRLANLVPEGIDYELIEEEEMVTLVVNVDANSLENLREIVDDLLTLFSDEDQ
jgi:hypothetical protein